MPRPKRWTQSGLKDGVGTICLQSWQYFHDYIYQEILDYRSYIWRGQRCDNWRLESTLDRVLRGRPKRRKETITNVHLGRLKLAARGRRGNNPPTLDSDNEWWALGQHHGLHTPLLDWTSSPFTAAYFAFIGKAKDGQTERRAVYALHLPGVKATSINIEDEFEGEGRSPIIEFVRPLSDENPGLVSQRGLFTRAPTGVDIEEWVRSHYSGKRSFVLMKITIPDADREPALRSLNRMNINHLSLFPDLYGASKFCNMDLEIDVY